MSATVVCGSFSMEIQGIAYKLLVAIELGIFLQQELCRSSYLLFFTAGHISFPFYYARFTVWQALPLKHCSGHCLNGCAGSCRSP